VIIPPPLPKEPFDPSPSSRTNETTPGTPTAKARAVQGGIALGKWGVLPLGVIYGVALIVKAIKPSWAGPIDDVLKFLKGE
jgi:hypothetical protein